MRHATSRELYAYWDRIRGSEPAPRRSAVEPGEIRRILADTFILEVLARGDYPVRLAGTRICGLYGREIKSAPFLGLWSEIDQRDVVTIVTQLCKDATGAVIDVDLVSARDRIVAGEFLLLPLRHGATSRDRILGCLALHRRPYWIGADPIVDQRITAMKLIEPDRRPPAGGASGNRLVSLPPAFFRAGLGRRHGHLYVVDGGRR
jgi:hypothetical protein